MKVVILCGGKGTRLREQSEFRPKPMIEIGGRPILWHIMKLYAHYGFCDFVLCLGYRGWDIKDYFLNYKAKNSDFTIQPGTDREIEFYESAENENWKITLADTGQDAMTGARIKRVAHHLTPGEEFMLTYGDGLADLDIRTLLAFHRAHGKIATLTAVHSVGRFGEVTIDDQDQVASFAEKPRCQETQRIAGGFFVFNYEMLDYLDEDPSCILERGPLEKLTEEGQLAAYRHNGYWQCMDNYREWMILNKAWSSGKAPWSVWQHSAPNPLNVDIPLPQGSAQPPPEGDEAAELAMTNDEGTPQE